MEWTLWILPLMPYEFCVMLRKAFSFQDDKKKEWEYFWLQAIEYQIKGCEYIKNMYYLA